MIDDILAAPSAAGSAHNTLATEHVEPSLSVAGAKNSSPVQAGANDPGLNSKSIFSDGATQMKKHWLWILAILAVILGFWYYSSSSATA